MSSGSALGFVCGCRTAALLALGLASLLSAATSTQSVADRFESVSIRRSDPNRNSGGTGTEPDGTVFMRGSTLAVAVRLAMPVEARDVIGLSDWATRDRYDITAKPPTGSTLEQQRQWWSALFVERMKLVAHVEPQDRDTYALVIAAQDRHVGPRLAPSTRACDSGKGPVAIEGRAIEGVSAAGGWIRADCMRIDRLVALLGGLVHRPVDNHTELDGFYSVDMKWARTRNGAIPTLDSTPDVPVALEQQLGLTLQPETHPVPVFVIDHIERPTDD